MGEEHSEREMERAPILRIEDFLCHDRITSDIHAPAAPSDDGHDCTYQAGIGRIIAPKCRMK